MAATLADDVTYRDAAIAVPTGERIEAIGAIVMRCALGFVFLWAGGLKFTSFEATTISPFVANSPLVGWWHALLGIQGTSNMLGVVEIATGLLLLAGFVKPMLSVIGGALAAIALLITLTFFFTTPGVAEPAAGGFPAISAIPGQFLLKDLGLFGIAIFLLGASLFRVHAMRGDGVSAASAPGWAHYRNEPIFGIGAGVIRYGLVIIFLWFGAMKFTSYEATGIAPFIANSPIVGWLHSLLGIQGASYFLGVFEIATGILLALYRSSPRAAVIGGAMAVLTFLITVTFLFSTPGVSAPDGFPVLSGVGQFLLKDLGLLGISIWLLGEAIVAAGVRAPASASMRA